MILIILSLLTFIILMISLVETSWGLSSIIKLESIKPLTTESEKVSVIIAARNEEGNITETLDYLKNQTYSNIEIICINDRSTDNTAKIISSFSLQDRRIKVINIENLPDGWLGKNHAVSKGALIATGKWLLFIDADVHLGPEALSRALKYSHENQLDHLTAFGHYICKGFLYNIVHLVYQGYGLLIPLKPWLARVKRSKKSINLGVFCLIKKTAYEKCGGHGIAPMECLEDCRLGERIKQQGFSQDAVNAQSDISLAWYPTLSEDIKKMYLPIFTIALFQ